MDYHSASELIKSLNVDKNNIIPEYQYELIKKIIKQNDYHYAENLKSTQSTHSTDESQAGTNEETDTVEAESEPTEPESDSLNQLKRQGDNLEPHEKRIMVMQVRHTAKLFNKRCIIAYHYQRLNRLKRLRWDFGNNLPREISDNLSKDELEWFVRYNDNLFSYMSSLNDGKGIDLTLYTKPPKKLYVQVKCIKDYGQFDLENGQPVMLKKDSIHYLPLNQCEKLIHQNILQQTER